MSVDEVSEKRTIQGFEVTVRRNGPMGIIASKTIGREVNDFLNKIERLVNSEEEQNE